MAQVWQCDRCDVVSRNGDVDDPPEDWVTRSMPVRGSEGARSSMDAHLCAECDDSLYDWFYGRPTKTLPRAGGDDVTTEGSD